MDSSRDTSANASSAAARNVASGEPCSAISNRVDIASVATVTVCFMNETKKAPQSYCGASGGLIGFSRRFPLSVRMALDLTWLLQRNRKA